MVLKLFPLHPSAVLQRITLWTFYKWSWCCCFQGSFFDFHFMTIMWSFHVKIKKPPFSAIFKMLLIPCKITVYATFFTIHDAPKEVYFPIDLTISVNFFRPPVCSNNVPTTKPSAPALIIALAVFADLMPPPTIINPSNTALTV